MVVDLAIRNQPVETLATVGGDMVIKTPALTSTTTVSPSFQLQIWWQYHKSY